MAGSTQRDPDRPPPLAGYDVFGADRVLTEAVARHLDAGLRDEAAAELSGLGRSCGSAQAQGWAEQAEADPPAARTHDRYGHRVDEVVCSPAWHRLLGKGVAAGLAGAGDGPGGQVRRAAGFLMWAQVEPGTCGPLSATHAAGPALRAAPELSAAWEPLLASRVYDQEPRPPHRKAGALFGRAAARDAEAARARPARDGTYELTGTWRCSAPMSDGFLVRAPAPGGPTCFLVPRVLPDGTRNAFAIQRLVRTPGNRSDALAEVGFAGTLAHRVGAEGDAAAVLAETVAAGRLDHVLGAAGLMRQAVARAVHHGGHPDDAPLTRNVLADLAVESEAATTLALRLAAARDDGGDGDERATALLRLAVPAAAYWVAGRCPAVVRAAAECLGEEGWAEESGFPRLVREAPLHSLARGGGSGQALEVVGVLERDPRVLDAYLTEVGAARGADRRLDAAIRDLLTDLADLAAARGRARRLAERLALVLQGALLVRHAPPEVADLFCASRLGPDAALSFGGLAPGADLGGVVERARPAG
ncbi:acyl-CoA dehydrogenase family protein [Streptomyces sp. NPDC003717]|uniref:acyl-CoA dehydrogenase family protein n=1 Tax=Streptomyces sp. NPDC003717 TaxID=3154276 RepID=UPI0033B3230C